MEAFLWVQGQISARRAPRWPRRKDGRSGWLPSISGFQQRAHPGSSELEAGWRHGWAMPVSSCRSTRCSACLPSLCLPFLSVAPSLLLWRPPSPAAVGADGEVGWTPWGRGSILTRKPLAGPNLVPPPPRAGCVAPASEQPQAVAREIKQEQVRWELVAAAVSAKPGVGNLWRPQSRGPVQLCPQRPQQGFLSLRHRPPPASPCMKGTQGRDTWEGAFERECSSHTAGTVVCEHLLAQRTRIGPFLFWVLREVSAPTDTCSPKPCLLHLLLFGVRCWRLWGEGPG